MQKRARRGLNLIFAPTKPPLISLSARKQALRSRRATLECRGRRSRKPAPVLQANCERPILRSRCR